MSFVVVGAGPAGVRVADRLAAAGQAVTLIGDEPGVPYDRVALSRYLAREVTAHDLRRPPALGVRHLAGLRIAAIDRAARRVIASNGRRIGYATLVLATGAAAFRLPLPGADLPHVRLYRTLADVETMIGAASRGGEAIVIGGGLLGLEAAAGLALRGMRVTVLHAADRLMERQLDPPAAARLQAHLAIQGMAVRTLANTQAITPAGVTLADGTQLPARLVVIAVGIRPNSALAAAAGLAVGRGIVVDDAMRTSDPAILACGECAEHRGQCVGLVAPALAQAEIAARTALGEPARYRASADSAALKIAGAPVWSAGEIAAPDTDALVLDDPDGGYRRLLLRNDRLVGAVLYGATEDARWYMRLIRDARPLGALRDVLPFGPAFA